MAHTILVVEKDPNLRQRLKRLLGGRFLLEMVASKEEALKSLQRQRRIALVISDLDEDDANGSGFLSQAQQLRPGIVTIILSEEPTLCKVIRAVNDHHIFGLFEKSFDPPKLLRKIYAGMALFHKRQLAALPQKTGLLTEEERLYLRTGSIAEAMGEIDRSPLVDR